MLVSQAELQAEMEMQLDILHPRHKRIEQDVHNVRAAEFSLHRERVTRHGRGMYDALNRHKVSVRWLWWWSWRYVRFLHALTIA